MSVRKQPKYNINFTFYLSLNISYIKAYIKEIFKRNVFIHLQTDISQ